MTTFTFKTREEYLSYRKEWKEKYGALSQDIRDLKNKRKQFKWQYRTKGDTTSKRRIKIGENPNYDSSAGWQVFDLKYAATAMLEELAEAKIEAGKQRAARLVNEKEAA